MKLIFKKTANLFYFLAVIALITVLVFFYVNTKKVKATGILVEHTQEVLAKSRDVLLDIINIETGIRGYLLSGNEIFLEPYNNSVSTVNSNLNALAALTKDNPHQQVRIDSLKKLSDEKRVLSEKLLVETKQGKINKLQTITLLDEGKNIADKIRNVIAAIELEEFALLGKRKAANERSNKEYESIFLWLIGLAILAITLLAIILKNQKTRKRELEIFNAAQNLSAKYSLSLMEASLDPMLTIDPEGKITDINKAGVDITGKLKEKITGSYFFESFTDTQKLQQFYQEIFTKGFVNDYLIMHKSDNKELEILFNGSVYRDEAQNVLGAVIVARDITRQKNIEKELTDAIVIAELATGIAEEAKTKAEAAAQIAEVAVKAKQQFLSNMSHEIRTPMNAIIGFTKVILKTDLSVKQREYLTAIKMSGDSLIVLINDILDLAKVDAGKMTFEQIPFKMASSISAMLHLFEPKIQEKNLQLIKEYDAGIPAVLIGDPVRLHQIIINLISNAVKFTLKGKITIAVKLHCEDNENAKLEFIVADTGIGIPENKIVKIFENFQQATSGTSRLYGGTGLGLSIVKQLVEAQGGAITVKSKIDEGSVFNFILGFKKTTEEALLDTGIVELDPEIKNIKVLVVEDIALNQLLMKTLLDDFGFNRDIAANGKIAVEKLQEKLYDVILMDLQMPEMNGFEATEYIRNTMHSKIPIIALTADVTTADLAKCKAVGMNDYIAKPVDEKLLYSKIIALVKKPTPALNQERKYIVSNEPKEVKCINLDYLLRRTKSDPVLMMDMISLYLEQTPPLVKAMKLSLEEKDWKLLNASVHKMIPSFSMMGIDTTFETIAKKVQEFASTQQESDGMHSLVLQLEDICGQACNELEEEFNSIKRNNSC